MGCPEITYRLTAEPRLRCVYNAADEKENRVAHDAQPVLLLRRGYTSHEHLPEFGLINMNARLYDPILGRFLSPDPFIADGTYSQDYNRYSYCLNNPLKYTDPGGKKIRPFNETYLTDNNSGSTGGGGGWMSAMDPTRSWGTNSSSYCRRR